MAKHAQHTNETERPIFEPVLARATEWMATHKEAADLDADQNIGGPFDTYVDVSRAVKKIRFLLAIVGREYTAEELKLLTGARETLRGILPKPARKTRTIGAHFGALAIALRAKLDSPTTLKELQSFLSAGERAIVVFTTDGADIKVSNIRGPRKSKKA